EGKLKILLIRRNEDPFFDSWALPGYFVREDEGLHTAAERVLSEMTGIENVYLEQVGTFGAPQRHSAGRVITVAYYSLIRIANFNPRPAGLAQDITWHTVADLENLAFDHLDIVRVAFQQLKKSIQTKPVGFELLPPSFTLTDLQHLYEAIWETKLEKRNFRKKILSTGLLRDLNQLQEGVAHRPAKLFAFDEERYRELEQKGGYFELRGGRK
ncbi:MAG: NUDIX domain-containing protein, partial [Bacteroidota bacterium]